MECCKSSPVAATAMECEMVRVTSMGCNLGLLGEDAGHWAPSVNAAVKRRFFTLMKSFNNSEVLDDGPRCEVNV